MSAFRQGLNETGYVEGRNVAIEYRWAEGQYDRLPALAADLVRRQVAVIVATAPPAAPRGQGGDHDDSDRLHDAATTRSSSASSPASTGRAATSLASVSLNAELGAKRLELLQRADAHGHHRLPCSSIRTIRQSRVHCEDVQAAARALGLQLIVLNASTEREIDAAFATLVATRADALLVAADRILHQPARQLVALAARHAVPAIYASREFAEAGGLMSYGASITDAYRQAGVYTGRILKGEKPADLPVLQSTKFELVINLKTAKALGLDVPPTLLARADEVIE